MSVFLAGMAVPLSARSLTIAGENALQGNDVYQGPRNLEPEIKKLSGLEALTITTTRIEELPMTIEELKGVKMLRLIDNPLLELLPPKLCQVEELEKLEIRNCPIQELNRVVSSKLLELAITNTSINSFPGERSCFKTLVRLLLPCNQIESFPWEDLAFAERLKSLNLEKNRIKSFATHNVPSLRTLNLRENEIEAVTIDAFQGSTSIQQIHLDGNFLNSFPEETLCNLCHLCSLSLTRNRISSFDVVKISHLTALVNLDLSMNPLQDPGVFSAKEFEECTLNPQGAALLDRIKRKYLS